MGNPGSNNFNYTFHGDPKATFAQFFGTSNPFENLFNMPGMAGNQVTKEIKRSYISHTKFYVEVFNSIPSYILSEPQKVMVGPLLLEMGGGPTTNFTIVFKSSDYFS